MSGAVIVASRSETCAAAPPDKDSLLARKDEVFARDAFKWHVDRAAEARIRDAAILKNDRIQED